MPYSSAPISVDTVSHADTLISTSLYPSPSMFNLDSQIFEELRVDKERHDSPVICIPHLVIQHVNGEVLNNAALTDATNELNFLFGAGMHQRKLLGFEREPMFGISCCNGKARAFASYWKDDKVTSMIVLQSRYRLTGQLNQIQIVQLYADDFDLQATEQACLFFILLLRIRHFISTFVSELETVDGSAIEERVKASERSWKALATYPPPPGTSWPSPVCARRSSMVTRRPGWLFSSESSAFPEEMDLDDSPGSVASRGAGVSSTPSTT